jgi:hypothetical protein
LVGTAVNVVAMEGQALAGEDDIVTRAETAGDTVIVIGFEVSFVVGPQG